MNANQVVVLTVEQLKEFATEVVREVLSFQHAETACIATESDVVYGLRGIRDLFNVSHATAQRYKNTFLQPAISQRGRKITVDVDMARRLFDEHNKQ